MITSFGYFKVIATKSSLHEKKTLYKQGDIKGSFRQLCVLVKFSFLFLTVFYSFG